MNPKFIIVCSLVALISATPVSMEKRGIPAKIKACFGCAGAPATSTPTAQQNSRPPPSRQDSGSSYHSASQGPTPPSTPKAEPKKNVNTAQSLGLAHIEKMLK